MTVTQTEKMLKEIWQARDKLVAGGKAGTTAPSLADVTYHYLQTKLGAPSQVVEAGYSLLFGLWRYQYDADCELFLKILTG